MINQLCKPNTTIPTVMNNTKINADARFSLDGWPAAATVAVICGTYITSLVIKLKHPDQKDEDAQPSQQAEHLPFL